MDLRQYLKLMVEKNASDMFYKAGTNVRLRVDGDLVPADEKIIGLEEAASAIREITPDSLKDAFCKNMDADFGIYLPELEHRFRISIFMQRGEAALVARKINSHVQPLVELNLCSDILKKLALEKRGLVLLTGSAGSGKSTTIASTIEHINQNCRRHILTIEEPIEFTFEDKNSVINQRELGLDVSSYAVGLRAFTLQSPDVIFIGNIRDLETMSAALTAAETGVLVLSTLHTVNAAKSVERIINFFPPYQHEEVQAQLASLLKGVISLRLLPLNKTAGRIPAYETMILTPSIARLIREAKFLEIPRFIEDGGIFGMQSFNQSLLKLVKEGKVSEEAAIEFADNRDEFILALKGIKKM